MNKYGLFTLLCLLPICTTAVPPSTPPDTSPTWKIRYVLFVDTARNFRQIAMKAARENADVLRSHNENDYLDSDELLTPTTVFNSGTAIVVLQFDRTGRVISQHPLLSRFQGVHRPNALLALVNRDDLHDKLYYFADWAESDSESVHYLPAPCTQVDRRRYGRLVTYTPLVGGFGCREWTAQLHRTQRPYIDVTSYGEHGNFIGRFMGWAGFGDTPKPVIGMHRKTWLCLHECPSGEQPGVIPDIRTWARKHGYPIPVAPATQPEYPDTETED